MRRYGRHSRRLAYLYVPAQPPRSPLFPYTTLFRSPSPRTNSVSASLPPCTKRQSGSWVEQSTPPVPPCATIARGPAAERSEEHTSELQSPYDLVCRLLLEKKKNQVKARVPEANIAV